MAITQKAHHIGLTVRDITATHSFFVDVLGFKQVGEVPTTQQYLFRMGQLCSCSGKHSIQTALLQSIKFM